MRCLPPSGWRQFVLILCVAGLLTGAVSHGLARWLHLVQSPFNYVPYGTGEGTPEIAVAGSSLTYAAVDWEEIARRNRWRMDTFGASSASPCEIEATPFLNSPAAVRVMGVSAYELNESNLSEVRGSLVPLRQSLADLAQSHTGWQASKRLASQYPLAAARWLFPTAGRSTAVMVGLRRELGRLVSHTEPEAGTVARGNWSHEKLSDWDEGRIDRNVVSTRSAIEGRHVFGAGPKELALRRILASASPARPLVILVLPVSPVYRSRVADAPALAALEGYLAQMLAPRPGLTVLRFDQEPALQDADAFGDLIHLNTSARASTMDRVEQSLIAAKPSS